MADPSPGANLAFGFFRCASLQSAGRGQNCRQGRLPCCLGLTVRGERIFWEFGLGSRKVVNFG